MGVYPQTQHSVLLLPFLAWEMEKRGGDSWGCTDGNNIIRKVGPITGSFELLPKAKSIIYHTRNATTGNISKENTHPFKFDGDVGTVIGIHNGVVINHSQLNTVYKRDFDVDSMHIFKHLSDGSSMTDIEAWGVILWYDKNKELSLCKISQSADMSLMRLGSGEIVFCSESSAIKRAARMNGNRVIGEWQGLSVGTIYHFNIEDNRPVIVEEGKLEFGSYNRVNYNYSRSNHCGINNNINSVNNNNNNSYSRWQEDLCKGCQEQKIFTGKEILCRKCFVEIRSVVTSRRLGNNTPAILPSSYINSGSANDHMMD